MCRKISLHVCSLLCFRSSLCTCASEKTFPSFLFFSFSCRLLVGWGRSLFFCFSLRLNTVVASGSSGVGSFQEFSSSTSIGLHILPPGRTPSPTTATGFCFVYSCSLFLTVKSVRLCPQDNRCIDLLQPRRRTSVP